MTDPPLVHISSNGGNPLIAIITLAEQFHKDSKEGEKKLISLPNLSLLYALFDITHPFFSKTNKNVKIQDI